MQMQQVQYFRALCEELSFTRAARRCGISQPSLTSAIGALERELGGALFQRKPSIALTGLGRPRRNRAQRQPCPRDCPQLHAAYGRDGVVARER